MSTRCEATQTENNGTRMSTYVCAGEKGHLGLHDDGVGHMWGSESHAEVVRENPPAEREADEAPERPCNFTREAWERRSVMAPGEGVRSVPEKEKMKPVGGTVGEPVLSRGVREALLDTSKFSEAVKETGVRLEDAVKVVNEGLNQALMVSPVEGIPDEVKKALMKNEGIKLDGGKLRFDLLPPFAEAEIVRVFTKGSVKYEPWNWRKGMAWGRIYAALRRHLSAWFQGEEFDQETGLRHLGQVAWAAIVLLEYQHDGIGEDDRPWMSKGSGE